MSLVAFGVRIAMVRILRACLPSNFVVLDSPADAADSLAANPGAALIAVYTGQSSNKLDGEGFFAGSPVLYLDLQIFLPVEMSFAYVDGSGAARTITLDTRAFGSETALDLIVRMIARAMAGQGDVWSQLVGALVQKIETVTAASYLVETAKIKAVAREVRMICETLQEPVPGASPAPVWTQLLAAMTADAQPDSVAPLAPWIAAEIGAPSGLAQGEIDRIFLGLSEYAAQSVQITASTASAAPLPAAEQADTETVVVADAVAGTEAGQ